MDTKPQIPTLKDSQRPQVKIKGLAARLSLVDRLKQFKKKDLAFILAGMGVLFMAPLAEHFMMSPENADAQGTFKPGWGFQSQGLGGSASPYETGTGMAPGSPSGGGGDVITPLNMRDPSALIMGPGAQQQAAATTTTPPPAAPAKENTDWKDAIANAATKGASAATKAASLPVPKTSLTNAGLRGLGVASGGGGGSYSLPPINSKGLAPDRAAGSNSLSGTKGSGFQGVARGNQNASAGSMDALKKAAANAGSDFNRQGSAATALEAASGRDMGRGDSGGGFGQGGQGKDDKGPGGNQEKGAKSLGESLEFMAAKDNAQKARDLAWKLKEKEAMRWPNLMDKISEELVMTPIKALTGQFADALKGLGDPASNAMIKCKTSDNWGKSVPKSKVDMNCTSGGSSKPGEGKDFKLCGGKLYGGAAEPIGYDCVVDGGNDSKTDQQGEYNAASQIGTPGTAGSLPGANTGLTLDGICQQVKKAEGTVSGPALQIQTGLLEEIKDLNGAGKMLSDYTPAPSCEIASGGQQGTHSVAQLNAAKGMLLGTGGVAWRLQAAVTQAKGAMGLALNGDPGAANPGAAAPGAANPGAAASSPGLAKATAELVTKLKGATAAAAKATAVTDAETAYDSTLAAGKKTLATQKEQLTGAQGIDKDIQKVEERLAKMKELNQGAKGLLEAAAGQGTSVTAALAAYKTQPSVSPEMVKQKQGWLDDVEKARKELLGPGFASHADLEGLAAKAEASLAKAKEAYSKLVPEELQRAEAAIDPDKKQTQPDSVGGAAAYVAKTVKEDTADPNKFTTSIAAVEKVPETAKAKVQPAIDSKEVLDKVNAIPVGFQWYKPTGSKDQPWLVCEAVAMGSGGGEDRCK